MLLNSITILCLNKWVSYIVVESCTLPLTHHLLRLLLVSVNLMFKSLLVMLLTVYI